MPAHGPVPVPGASQPAGRPAGGGSRRGVLTIASLPRLWRTLKHLKGKQLLALLGQRAGLSFFKVPLTLQDSSWRNVNSGAWRRGASFPAHSLQADSAFGAISGLGKTWHRSPGNWHNPEASRLWNYELFYHGFIADSGASDEALADLLEDWLSAELPADASDPYPTAQRILNWCLLAGSGSDGTSTHPARLPEALQKWIRDLAVKPEYHLFANHLAKDFVALEVARCFPFPGPVHVPSAETMERLFDRWVIPQVLGDGVHEEGNVSYHLEMMRDLWLVSCVSTNGSLAAKCRKLVEAMVPFALASATPGEGWDLWGDTSVNSCPDQQQFLAWAEQELGKETGPEAVSLFPEIGIGVYQRGPFRVSVKVKGPGPAHQPGHSHGDCGHLNLHWRGRPVLLDGGNHGYDGDPFRALARSAALHNVLLPEGGDQGEFWATFRLGRRPGPATAGKLDAGGGDMTFDGYRYLSGSPFWKRRFELGHDGLAVFDSLKVSGRSRGEVLLLLARRPEPRQDGAAWCLDSTGGEELWLTLQGFLPSEVQETDRFPALGSVEKAWRLRLPLECGGDWQGKWEIRVQS